MSAGPRVGVVVVNWFGGERTLGCLRSLGGLTWPTDRLEVALVDNGSEPGWVESVQDELPHVRVVETGVNLGFGGACNRGFEALKDCDHVALLNNDAIPDPGWLEPLVEVLEADPGLGAVTPKVLLADRYVEVEVRSAATRPGGGDTRSLGVQLCGARVDGEDVSHRLELVSGFWGWEQDPVTVGGSFAWSDGRGRVLVPVASERPSLELRIACGNGRTDVELSSRGVRAPVSVDHRPEWVDLGPVPSPVDVVNNAGTELRADGSTADRGFLQPDGPDFAEPREVFGWSGAAVVLARRYLEDVRGFDERYFLYSEDADVSWRGRLAGWSYRYEPRSVVRHEHSATVGDRSALVRHLAARNRLLLLTKCAPVDVVRRQVRRHVGVATTALWRDVIRRPASGRLPMVRHVGAEARVLAGYLRLRGAARAERAAMGVDEATRRAVFDRWVVG